MRPVKMLATIFPGELTTECVVRIQDWDANVVDYIVPVEKTGAGYVLAELLHTNYISAFIKIPGTRIDGAVNDNVSVYFDDIMEA